MKQGIPQQIGDASGKILDTATNIAINEVKKTATAIVSPGQVPPTSGFPTEHTKDPMEAMVTDQAEIQKIREMIDAEIEARSQRDKALEDWKRRTEESMNDTHAQDPQVPSRPADLSDIGAKPAQGNPFVRKTEHGKKQGM